MIYPNYLQNYNFWASDEDCMNEGRDLQLYDDLFATQTRYMIAFDNTFRNGYDSVSTTFPIVSQRV